MEKLEYEVGDIVRLKNSIRAAAVMGDFARGSGLPVKMHRLWTSDYDRTKACRKKIQKKFEKKLEIMRNPCYSRCS